ncbi:MAG: glycoside hydrolase family 16 protein [Bacteroidales bacterium]|nr:glycoside hydrolase family 16 protein [Bacteroidales bacterium]
MKTKSIISLAMMACCIGGLQAQDYPINYEPDAAVGGVNYRYTISISLNGGADGDQTLDVDQLSNMELYQNMLTRCFTARPGETLQPEITLSSKYMHGYVYIDYDNDGQFAYGVEEEGQPSEGSEVVAYSYYNGRNSLGKRGNTTLMKIPEFTLPEDIAPGVYRMRYKVDYDCIDPAGSTTEGDLITDNGGAIIDLALYVHNADETATITLNAQNGTLLQEDGSPLPTELPICTPLTLAKCPDEGYALRSVTVTYGPKDLEPQHGTPTRFVHSIPMAEFRSGSTTVPGYEIVGDVVIDAVYGERTNGNNDIDDTTWTDQDYILVWNDEFNLEEGDHPDTESKWGYSPRYSSAWNRFNSSREDLYVIEDGALAMYGRANTDDETDEKDFQTAALQTSSTFSFTFGVVEAKVKTTPHSGNFPAFWMMPMDQSDGWPNCGEIDIWEQINTENRTYHTIHGYWTSTSGGRSGSITADMTDWHVYALEWEEDLLRWYVDGTLVLTQKRDASDTSKYAWPFNKAFYVIINQAVGNGSWAYNYDASFEYCTRFDYVRIYQKEGDVNSNGVVTGVKTVAAEQPLLSVVGEVGGVRVATTAPQQVLIHDMSGRLVKSVRVAGSELISLPRGLYIVAGQKALVR